MIDTILFDMDGVICHTNPWHAKAFNTFFAKRGLNPSEAEFKEHMYGKSNSYIMSHFLGRKIEGEELLVLENEKESLFRELYVDNVEPIEGYMNFLGELVAQGFKLGVATSAPIANMELILNALKIKDVFGSTLASEDVTAHKPDPQVYLKSAANLDSDPSTCMVFEDSFSGASAAINAKMKVVGVLSSHSKDELPPCDFYIDQYDLPLRDFLKSLNV